MGNKWREIRVGDLVSRGALWISDGYRVRNEELGPAGVPFVRGRDIGDGWINTDTEDHIRPEFADRVRAKLTQPGDSAFITKGTVGRAGRLRPDQPSVVFAPQVAYWRVTDRTVLDPGFVFYLMQSYEFQSTLDGVKTHGAMVADYVSISQQHNFRFRFPDVETQRAIAHVLGTLDDKIELNRWMNATLEAMARALFQSWFVDFDPVRAKAEGREPAGMDAATAALFPDEFKESEIGEIPKGWQVKRIDQLAEINTLSLTNLYEIDLIDYIEISEVSKGEVYSIQRYPRGKEPSRARRRLRHGDTVLSTVRPERESYFLCFEPEPTLIASTGFAVVTPTTAPWTFVHVALTRPEIFEYLGQVADGGAYPAIRADVIAGIEIIWPANPAIVEKYHRLCEGWLAMAEKNKQQSRTLVALRDALLPRLLSGELSVTAITALAEDA